MEIKKQYDKMSKKFEITFICREDIVDMIESADEDDKLREIFLIKEAEKITDEEMRWMASKLSDGFCDCCFWSMLRDRFEQLIKEKNDNEKTI